jgi:hypothetical protein
MSEGLDSGAQRAQVDKEFAVVTRAPVELWSESSFEVKIRAFGDTDTGLDADRRRQLHAARDRWGAS